MSVQEGYKRLSEMLQELWDRKRARFLLLLIGITLFTTMMSLVGAFDAPPPEWDWMVPTMLMKAAVAWHITLLPNGNLYLYGIETRRSDD